MNTIVIENQLSKVIALKNDQTFFFEAVNYIFPPLAYIAFKCQLSFKGVCTSPLVYLYGDDIKIDSRTEHLFDETERLNDLGMLASLGFINYCDKFKVNEKLLHKGIRFLKTFNGHTPYINFHQIFLYGLDNKKRFAIVEHSVLVNSVVDFLQFHPQLPYYYILFLRNTEVLENIMQSAKAKTEKLYNEAIRGNN